MIYYIPWGDYNTASSRLRIYNICPYLASTTVGVPAHYQRGDLLIIQKQPAIEELRRARSEGAVVLYDIDDYYWEDHSEFAQMIQETDFITVDTEYKRDLLPRAFVVPDCLDWDGVTVKQEYKGGKVVGWTGYAANSHYLNGVSLPSEFHWRLITGPDWPRYFYGHADWRSWSTETVDKDLAECDLSIYYLNAGNAEQCKGMHKLLKSWAIGLPCYTSPVPDYVKANREAGVDYIVTDWQKLEDKGFDPRCREYALRYTAEKVAKQWQEIIDICLLDA